jgi:hypothetical protein
MLIFLIPGVPVELAADPLFPAEVAALDDVRFTQTLYLALFTGCEMGSCDACGNIRFGVGRDVGKKLELLEIKFKRTVKAA